MPCFGLDLTPLRRELTGYLLRDLEDFFFAL